ncbi:MAG TPA: helix-turn-helix domain-containing protein [Rubrobacter sp.]|jgi:AcrR family transcriptional regulator|nr:helix-turn-helix domain-containing protein [Rubrobacter sp.]
MTRKYDMKRRAKRQEETRRRIVEATVELHQTVGMERTTISAIAEKAGVQRLTVYRHFPDERALFRACTGHWRAANPRPDPAWWTQVADPEGRLRVALLEVYAYHRRTEPMMTNVIRDAQVHPLTREMAEPYFRHWERMRYVLATGWGVEDERLPLLLAALGHALDFRTWRSLVREQGLDDEQAVEVMVCAVRCVAHSG